MSSIKEIDYSIYGKCLALNNGTGGGGRDHRHRPTDYCLSFRRGEYPG